MTIQESEHLLRQARRVLETHLFDGDSLRDDVAEVCMRIDDVLPEIDRPAKAIEQIEDAA